VNNADSWAKISSISTNAIVRYDGNVTWLSTVIFKSSCQINVKYFPFDEQMCDMVFASWTFDGFFLDININTGEGDTTNYIKNGEWHLVKILAIKHLKMYSCCEEPYPELQYKFIIRRRPLYYVFNLVFPCLLITMVAFLGFYLPPGSNEKVSIGITTLLSLTVFLMLVAESMPPTSELPLLGIYYAVTIGIVSFSTAMAVFTLNVNNKGSKGRKVPHIIRVIFFNYLAKLLRTKLKNEYLAYRPIEKWKNYQIKPTKKNKKINPNIINLNKNHAEPNVNLVDIIETNKKLSNNMRKMSKSKSRFDEKSSTGSKFINDSSPNSLNIVPVTNKLNSKRVDGDKYEIIDQIVFKTTKLSKSLNKLIPNNNLINTNKNSNIENSENSRLSFSHSLLKQDDKIMTNYIYPKCSNTSNTEIITTPTIHRKFANKKIKQTDEYNFLMTNTEYNEQNLILNENDLISSPNSLAKKTYRHNRSIEFLNELEKILAKQFDPLIKMIVKTLTKNEHLKEEKEKYEVIQNEWSDVAMILDHILCYLFLVITGVSCFVIFSNSPLFFSEW
jgi:hypothetical protein